MKASYETRRLQASNGQRYAWPTFRKFIFKFKLHHSHFCRSFPEGHSGRSEDLSEGLSARPVGQIVNFSPFHRTSSPTQYKPLPKETSFMKRFFIDINPSVCPWRKALNKQYAGRDSAISQFRPCSLVLVYMLRKKFVYTTVCRRARALWTDGRTDLQTGADTLFY